MNILPYLVGCLVGALTMFLIMKPYADDLGREMFVEGMKYMDEEYKKILRKRGYLDDSSD